jgi:hypothetical protein
MRGQKSVSQSEVRVGCPLRLAKKSRGFMLSPEVIEPLRLRAKSEGWGESYFIELALRQALGLQN